MEKTMTLREFYESIVEGREVTEEMKEIAVKKIEQLDKKNEYARNHKKSGNSKKAKENAELRERLLAKMEDGKVYKAGNFVDSEGEVKSVQKASSLLKGLVDEGKLTVSEERVKGNRLVKTYMKVA